MLSVKICLLKKELKIGEIKEWFWTDNKAVIGYIKNDAQRFKTLLLREYNKLEVTLMCSNSAMFQREKSLLMVLLEV